jgi:hypothetical protein
LGQRSLSPRAAPGEKLAGVSSGLCKSAAEEGLPEPDDRRRLAGFALVQSSVEFHFQLRRHAPEDGVEVRNLGRIGDTGAAHDLAAGVHGITEHLIGSAGFRNIGEFGHVSSISVCL